MEKLMNKIVAKPNLIADDVLNGKIEKMFNNPLFQRMVERAEIIQDISSTSQNPNDQTNKKKQQAKLFAKAAEAGKKDADEELPHFGAEEKEKKKGGLKFLAEDIESPPPKPTKGKKQKKQQENRNQEVNKQESSFGNNAKEEEQPTTPKKYIYHIVMKFY